MNTRIFNMNKKEKLDKLVEELIENNIYTTESVYELKNILLNSNKAIRIFYDGNYQNNNSIGRYFWTDATGEYTHWNMLETALKNAYYDDLDDVQDDWYTTDLGTIIFIPNNADIDNSQWPLGLGSDGYGYSLKYKNFYILLRTLLSWRKIPLIDILGKVDSVIDYFDKEEINLSDNSSTDSAENYFIIYSGNTLEKVIYAVGTIVVREDTEKINHHAFYNTNVNKVVLPESIKEIGECAFMDCDVLNSINLPNSIKEIKRYTFEGCRSLKEIKLPKYLEVIDDGAFYTSGLTDVKFPSTLRRIGAQAFRKTLLTNVTIPKKVTEVGTEAFAYAEMLRVINVLGNLKFTRSNCPFSRYVYVRTDSIITRNSCEECGITVWTLDESLNEELLLEKTRQELINKSKSGAFYAPSNRAKGRNRWERRRYSQVSNTVRDYNSINMNEFWKKNVLNFNVKVKGETDNYEVAIRFENILDELQREVKGNNNKLEFKCVLRALIDSFNKRNVYIHCTCLHPTTLIKMFDGSVDTVENLKKRFDSGEELIVESSDFDGLRKRGIVEKVWITSKARNFIKVTLDNNKELMTTPNHPYLLDDKTYMLAEYLREGQKLIKGEIITKVENIELNTTPVYDIKVKEWNNFVTDAGAVLHNCPDFTYRFAYHATQDDYNSGQPEMRPNRFSWTNKEDKDGAGCKHINLVIANTDWMMKIASVINNYIKYCRDNLQRSYADIIFPAIYNMPYKKAVQLSLFDEIDDDGSPLLPSDRETLSDIINKGFVGKDERGKFVKGNEYRFTKKDEPKPTEQQKEMPLFKNKDASEEEIEIEEEE